MTVNRPGCLCLIKSASLCGGVFRNGLGTFADGVLSQLTGQNQTNGRLDFATTDGRALVVVCQARRLRSDTAENIFNKTVHDTYCVRRNASARMHLLQHFVNIDCVGFITFAFLLILVRFSEDLLSFTSRFS